MTITEKETPAQDRPDEDIKGGGYGGFEVFYGILLLFLSFMVLASSGLFVVHEIQINGNQTLTKPEIIAASRLEARQTLFQIACNEARIQQNLLHDVRIASCNISLRFPNQVTITIKERRPLCFIENENNLLLVSNDGIVLGTGTRKENHLPVITGIPIRKATVGERIRDPKMQTALTIIREADAKLQHNLEEIDLRHQLLFLSLPDPNHLIRVELGSSENIITKMANLRAILTHTDVNLLDKIDLRVAELPSIIKANGNHSNPSPPAVNR